MTSPRQDVGVGLPAQDVADRRRDLALGEDPGRELVEQRLEQVVVGAVDHRDLDRAHGRSALAANSPPKPQPTITT